MVPLLVYQRGNNMEKDKALAAALSQIEKSYGKGSVMILGQRQEMNIESIPTGSVGLDVALGVVVSGLPNITPIFILI